jgi:hypothetical protein
MTIRATGALLCALCFLCASSLMATAQTGKSQSYFDFFGGELKNSDRMGGGGGKGTAKTTTVKSSKSNTSDRMGGGGGAKGAGSSRNTTGGDQTYTDPYYRR